MDGALAWREQRTVSQNLTLQYDRIMIMLKPGDLYMEKLRGKRVTVCDYPDGRLSVEHEGRSLPYSIFDKLRTNIPGKVVENKNLSAAMGQIRAIQKERGMARSKSAPRRRGQAPSVFTAPAVAV